MTSMVGQLVLAGILLLAGLGLWTTAGLDRDLADAADNLASLQYDQAVATIGERTTGVLRQLPGVDESAGRADVVRDTARYWQGTPEPTGKAAKPTLLSANAAYHAAMVNGGKWPELVGKLDEVVKQYASVVREDPANQDAAFNYEFVVRLRAGIAASKRDLQAGFVPMDTTIHGVPGAPPPSSDTKTFKMIVPMQPDERREAEQAGRGAPRRRKG